MTIYCQKQDEPGALPITGDTTTHYKLYEEQRKQQIYHFYISSEITEPNNYIDLINKIQLCKEGDVVYLHLNTPGGHLDTGAQIINAMKTSAALIVTCLEGHVASLGALMFLAGDEYIVMDNTLLMIHNYSGGMFGKGNELAAQVTGIGKWCEKFTKDVCFPFLSEHELERVFKGEDFWLDADEVRKRIKKVAKYWADQEEEKVKKQEERRERRSRTTTASKTKKEEEKVEQPAKRSSRSKK